MPLTDYDFSRHTIQDPIHGGITFGSIEKALIDHRLFQRLHGLRQNSLLYLVFPSANHTRFDHSVGVMWLAGQLLDAILRNQEKLCQAGASRTAFQDPYRVDDEEMQTLVRTMKEDKYFKLTLRVAALFHDIGHGPLSHLFDKFFPAGAPMLELMTLPQYEHIRARLSSLTKEEASQPIKHETLSCVIATRILWDCAEELTRHGIDAGDMAKDVCSVIDGRIEPSHRFDCARYKVQSLCHDILSSDIDVDRMDYLLRDSHMCGVNYGVYDPDRILKSMCAYGRQDTKELRLAVRYSGLGALEDLLFARYQMYAQIYGHKTNRACNAMLERIRDRLQNTNWSWYDGCQSLGDLLAKFADLDDQAFVDMLLDPATTDDKVREIAQKLFRERRLVKRVYEERVPYSETAPTAFSEAKQRWYKQLERLKAEGIWAAEDEFENKGPKLNSEQYPMKALRKHPRDGHYLVHELREFCTAARFLPEKESTFRIYCKSSNVSQAKALVPT